MFTPDGFESGGVRERYRERKVSRQQIKSGNGKERGVKKRKEKKGMLLTLELRSLR